MCITQNISRDGLYFKSEHLSYREGMRLTISFLRHADLFAPNASYTGQIIRVDGIEDGRVGVAVKLVGNIKPPTTPIPSQREVLVKGIGHGLAVVPGHLCRSLRGTGIRIVRWPVPHFGRIWHSAAQQASALVRLWTTVAKLCKNTIGEWRKSTGGLVRSSCSAALAISLGKGAQFVKISSKAREHLAKYLCNLVAVLVRAKNLGLCPSVSRRRPWLKGIAKQLLSRLELLSRKTMVLTSCAIWFVDALKSETDQAGATTNSICSRDEVLRRISKPTPRGLATPAPDPDTLLPPCSSALE